MGEPFTLLLMILLGLLVAFAVVRSVVSVIRLARTQAADRREVSVAYLLSIGALAVLGIAALVVGFVFANIFYALLGAYVLFAAAHYYAARRLP